MRLLEWCFCTRSFLFIFWYFCFWSSIVFFFLSLCLIKLSFLIRLDFFSSFPWDLWFSADSYFSSDSYVIFSIRPFFLSNLGIFHHFPNVLSWAFVADVNWVLSSQHPNTIGLTSEHWSRTRWEKWWKFERWSIEKITYESLAEARLSSVVCHIALKSDLNDRNSFNIHNFSWVYDSKVALRSN